MQTFLVCYDLEQNAKYLDSKRLFKQLLEGKQILDVVLNNKSGWSNHPAVLQWKGYPIILFRYIRAIWDECRNRGIAKDSLLYRQCNDLMVTYLTNNPKEEAKYPDWWGREDIISSHRSRLLCKGLIDSYCSAIKKALKIRSIDTWLKSKLNKTKNQLRYEDVAWLSNFYETLRIDTLKPNYYAKFNWKDEPSMPYIWPVSK